MKNVRIYTTPHCGYCSMAKELLEAKGIGYEEIAIRDRETRNRVREESGWPTVPVIYIGDELVGGYQELSALSKAGQLERMLAD